MRRVRKYLTTLFCSSLTFHHTVPSNAFETGISVSASVKRIKRRRIGGNVFHQQMMTITENEEEEGPLKSSMSTKRTIDDTETLLRKNISKAAVTHEYLLANNNDYGRGKDNNEVLSRRLLIASALFATGTIVAPSTDMSRNPTVAWAADSSLQYKQSPINKRYGITVFDAEKEGYNLLFITYLSRFLLNFDVDCQRYWYSKAEAIPRTATAKEVDDARLEQFGAFSASVEVGLQEYRGADGPKRLMSSLLSRYCPDLKKLSAEREAKGLPPLSEGAEAKKQREIKEARRQIALLFGLLETNQPVEEISKLLAAIDNGSIVAVNIIEHGSGYAPGYGAPVVTFPPPEAGSDEFETALGRAKLRPNGRILRIDLNNRGFGYVKAPTVTLSPPKASLNLDPDNVTASTATANAYVYRSGPNKGRLERIQVLNPGSGYTQDEVIRVKLSPPELSPANGGVVAQAEAIPELEVDSIEIVSGGSGYAVEKPLQVTIEPPPITARINMNDPMMARMFWSVPPDRPTPTKKSNNKKTESVEYNKDAFLFEKEIYQLASNEGKGGGGGCVGRLCYDRAVAAQAIVRSEIDSYNKFLNDDDERKVLNVEAALKERSAASLVRGVSSGSDSNQNLPTLPFFGGPSSSSQLLSLLPDGIGLQYKEQLRRFVLQVSPDMDTLSKGLSNKPFDPEFGPRGRSPIESDKRLGLGAYLRFGLSGAICGSAAHLSLTPIDVVKTKVQTDPVKYPSMPSALKSITEDEGFSSFFTGWVPTFIGFFFWGGFSYAATEFLRRSLIDYAGPMATTYEVPIILVSAATASILGSFILTPFEAVRIRSVAQPDFAPSIQGVLVRIVKEEGIPSLFSAIPVMLPKEILFAMAKFAVFDLSTAAMYDSFPSAREDLKLSLLISLLGGILGGIGAAIVSNPNDAMISEMKKAKTKMGSIESFDILWKRGGIPEFFRGLPLRMFFYSLIVSIQFLLYDAIRIQLGIGTDDLKLYLDVLGGALNESFA